MESPRMAGRRCAPGFTLIELNVVVVIVGLLAAFAIPMFAKLAQKASHAAREAAARAEEGRRAGQAEAEKAPAAPQPTPPDLLPDFASASIELRLAARYDRRGLEIDPGYEAAYSGRFLVRGAEGGGGPVRLFFPFPDATVEARDVWLYFVSGESKEEARGVVYDKRGIHWNGALRPGQELLAEVAFTATGARRLIQRLPPSRRTRDLKVSMDLEGVSAEAIPEYSLKPTSVAGSRASWASHNLVSDRDIIVDIPPAPTPLGRVSLLFKFVGLAVLLFGAGFWYMNERRQPGFLDDFKWGHFLLLAGTYCLFFVNFAVLSYHGHLGTAQALAAAAVSSLPLLVIHVARLITPRFALTQALPLAVLTLGLVVNGVYGGAYRAYMFMAVGYIVIAYLTLTYPVRLSVLARRAA